MDEQTEAVVTALQAVAQHMPDIVHGLEDGTLSTTKQAEFAELLIGLRHLLQEYADTASVQAERGDNQVLIPDAPPDALT